MVAPGQWLQCLHTVKEGAHGTRRCIGDICDTITQQQQHPADCDTTRNNQPALDSVSSEPRAAAAISPPAVLQPQFDVKMSKA